MRTVKFNPKTDELFFIDNEIHFNSNGLELWMNIGVRRIADKLGFEVKGGEYHNYDFFF